MQQEFTIGPKEPMPKALSDWSLLGVRFKVRVEEILEETT